jgi:hypothetical protein
MQLDAVPSEPGLPVLEVEEGDPDTRALAQSRAARRAAAICLRRFGVAPLVQSEEGVSAIIVREPLRRTRW